MFRDRNNIRLAIVILIFIGCCATFGQTLKPGPQVSSFFSDIDDTEQPYGLYLPRNFNPARKYPLVISLHGAGSNHRLNLRRVFGKSNIQGESDEEATRYFPQWNDVDYIVASPLARGTMGYQGVAEKDVYDVLADVQKRFPIDPDRIYLTGLSMGGGGTLWLGLSRPDIWAALAPVCPAPPDNAKDLAPNALNLPIHIFQGDADKAVDPEKTRQWVKLFQSLGTKVEYTEYPGVGHDSWENAYKDGAIFTWFSQFKRNRFPDQVRFTTSQYKYDTAYWVQISELTPGTPAKIEAKFIAPNQIEITTLEVGAFTLRLAGHPKYKSGPPIQLVIDGKPVKAVGDSVSLRQGDGKWAVAPFEPNPNAKHRGSEGPIMDAFSSRYVYVFGTGGAPSPEELQARRDQATYAAAWSPPLGRLLLFPRVIADNSVRPSDLENANLILFGTPETNTLIAKFSDSLPFRLKSTASGYGLLYIFPNGAHYVVVSSGLPWWTPAPVTPGNPPARRGYAFIYNDFMNHSDYRLFKGSADNIIASGRFDSNWRMPAADVEKMRSSGAIQFGN